MNRSTAISLVLLCSGAGVGFIAAKMNGVLSWLDARLYMLAGVVLGAAVSGLINRAGRGEQK